MRPLFFAIAFAASWQGARASVLYNFEPTAYTGSAGGTSIAGQNGWTTPTGTASVYTYASNAPGFPSNPNGATQFLGATQSNPTPETAPSGSRARQSLDLSSSNLWTMDYDLIASSTGATDNTGIFNFANVPILDNGVGSATGGVLLGQLLIWDTANTGSTFSIEDNGSDSSGTLDFFISPGGTASAFNHLLQNHWYHISVTMDLAGNRVTQESIQDLTAAGAISTYVIAGFFLDGGQNHTIPTTQFGLTVIGDLHNSSTNQVGIDNIAFTGAASGVPEPSTFAMLGGGIAALLLAARRRS